MIADIPTEIIYPSSDGKPMADNTLQFRWIVTIEGGIESVFRADPNVFVAGDLLWYPVEGKPRICVAPDTMVVFGRPKGDRKSYKQWEEGNIGPQVVFEILSHSNDLSEMLAKQDFYEEHGVEEYYLYDPYKNQLWGWIRKGDILRKLHSMDRWVSPLLKIRFELNDDLKIFGPDGKQFLSYPEVVKDRNEQAQRAEIERQRADTERQRADTERQRAEIAEKRYQELLARLSTNGKSPDSPTS